MKKNGLFILIERARVCLWLGLLGLLTLTAAAQTDLARLSVATNGVLANAAIGSLSASADGRYVVFQSAADNLVSSDTNNAADIFLLDRVTGDISLVSVSSTGEQANGPSDWPRISADGQYIAFQSAATNLVAGDSNGKTDVFLRDRINGLTIRVSVTSAAKQANADCLNPAISADGHFIAFQSIANNLVTFDTNNAADIFVYDRVTAKTDRASVSSSSVQGDNASSYPTISGDGRFVAFQSNARNLVSGTTNRTTAIYVRDRSLNLTECASISSAGAQANSSCSYPAISRDGRFVAFQANADNLVSGDTNTFTDIFLHDRASGETVLASISNTGSPGNGSSSMSIVSEDGHYVIFQSSAASLGDGATNGVGNIFVYNRLTAKTALVNLAPDNSQADGASSKPVITDGGQQIGFLSTAQNLVAGASGTDQIYWETYKVAPALSGITNVVMDESTSYGPIPFIAYAPTASPDELTLTASSTDSSLIDASGMVFGGSGTNRTLVLTPVPHVAGTATITLSLSDGTLSTNISFLLTVNQVHEAPEAGADYFSTDENVPLIADEPGVLLNDIDYEGNGLQAILQTGPSHGVLDLNTNGSFTYTPDTNWLGSDSFTYTAFDGVSNSAPATVTIITFDPNPVFDIPVANPDSYTFDEDTTLTVAAPGVLGNDVDINNDVLEAILIVGPTHGTLTLNLDGSFTYRPTLYWYGSDSFTYLANDGLTDSDPVTVNLTVNWVNHAPFITSPVTNQTGMYGTPYTLTFSASTFTDIDHDALTYTANGLPPGITLDGNIRQFSGTPTQPGDYQVELVADDGRTPSLKNTNTFAFHVAPAPLTVQARNLTRNYGAENPTLTFDFIGLVNGDATNVVSGAPVLETIANTNSPIGDYVITVAVGDLVATNYSLILSNALLTVAAAPLTVTADSQTKIYGEADPTLTYQITSGQLVNGDTFSGALTRVAGENVGSYAINQGTLLATTNYALTYVGTNLDITTRALTVTADGQSKIYGEADPTLTYQISTGQLVNGDTLSGALTRVAGENVGSYAINQGTLSASGNYALTYAGANLNIGFKTLVAKAQDQSRAYGATNPVLVITYEGFITNEDSRNLQVLPVASTVAETNSPIGSYEIVLSGGSDTNYSLVLSNGTLTVTLAALTVTADSQTKVYGDADPALTYQITSGQLVNGDTLSGSLTRVAGETIGSYAVNQGTLLATTNYALTYVGTNLDITARALTVTADSQTKIYGEADPALTYQITSGQLVNGDTFSGVLTRVAGENVGNYAINQGTLLATTNYALTYVGTNLDITARALTVAADGQTKVYGEADPALTYQITSGQLVNGDTFSGALARVAGENVGSYAINQGTLSASSNYALTYAGANLNIGFKTLVAKAQDQSRAYGATNPVLVITYEGFITNEDSRNLQVLPVASTVAETNSPIGSYEIVLSGGSDTNYSLVLSNGTLTVTLAALTVTADGQTKVYGDADPALTYQITSGQLLNGDTLSGALTRVAGETIGSYAINQGSLLATTNYTLTYVGTNLDITARALTVTADSQTKIYGEADPSLTYQITAGQLVNGDELSGALTRVAGETIGSYAINQGSLLATTNYALTYVGTNLDITARALTVVADGQSKIYGEADPSLTYQITSGQLVNGDTLSGSLVRVAGETIGHYAINQGTLLATTNYALTYVGTNLDITARALTVAADGQTKVYGDADPSLTYQITSGQLVNGDTFSGALTRVAGENVGSYAINQGTLLTTTNYALTYVGTNLDITTRALTVTADGQSKIYGEADPALTYQITTGQLVSGDTFSGALARVAGENVGSYAINQGTLSASSNYALTYAGANLNIGFKTLVATAQDQSRAYGATNPVLVIVYDGFITNEDSRNLQVLPVASTVAETNSPIGSYEIVLSGGSDTNYSLVLSNGTLTVTLAALTVTADSQTKVYGDADPSLTYQITSGQLLNGDTLSGALTRVAGETIGSYAINQGTLLATTNYTLTYVGTNLDITARALTVAADGQTKVYGEADPSLTYQITTGQLVNGDELSGALTRVAGETIGRYAINQGTLLATTNYTLTYVGTNLDITARALTVAADSQTKVYGDADPALTYQITSGQLVNGDTLSGSLTRVAGETIGSYAINQGTLLATTNYTLTYVGTNLDITARALTVAADGQTKVYGEADPALTYQITSGQLVNGDTFSGALTRVAGENVGSYAINQGTLLATTNYALTYVGTNLDITARALTVTADGQSKIYGEADPALTYQITTGQLVNGDTFSGALTRVAGENVGSYAINQGTLSASGNYALTYAGANLNIGFKTLVATAQDQSRAYGATNPVLVIVYDGFITNEDSRNLQVLPVASTVAETNSPIGNYEIVLSGGSDTNYSLVLSNGTLTVTLAALTVTADSQTKVYGDADPSLTYQITSGQLLNGDTLSGALTRVAGETIGSYAVNQGTLLATTNYALTYVGTNLDITARALTVAADGQTKVYGDADPALTYQITSGQLVNGDTFSGALTRVAGETIGSYAINQGSLLATTNYALTYVGTNLDITARALTVAADSQTKVYGDADPALTYQITSGQLVNGDTLSGSLARVAGETIGHYAINQGTLLATTNYALTYVGTNLDITARALTVAADGQTKVYGDADPALTYQITSGQLVNGDTFRGALARVAGENVGSYAINQGTLLATTNYALTYVGTNLDITTRALTVTADGQSKIYGEADPTLTYQITTGQLVNGDTLSGALARVAGETIGSYAINQGTLVASANYAFTYVGNNLAINARALTVAADSQSKVYGESDPALTYQITSGQLVNGDTLSGSLTRVAGETIGHYAINQGSLLATTNYALTYVGTNLDITARALTVAADGQTKVYGDADPALTYQLTSGQLVNGDTFSGALTRVAGENVGSYAINQGTLLATTNYALTYVGTNLDITARALTVAADGQTKVYGAADPALTYQITSGQLVNGDTFSGGLARVAGEAIGHYAINQGTLLATTNYALTYVGTNLDITARTLTVTADSQTKVYGEADPSLTYQITSGQLMNGDTLSGALTRVAGETIGHYAINQGTLLATTNYTLTYVGTNLDITARALTVAADGQTKVYGEADPALTYQITTGQLVNGDTLSGALARAAGETVGSYAINQGTLLATTNYALTYIGTNLVINQKALNITVNDAVRAYGEENPTFTSSITGVVTNDVFSVNYLCAATPASAAGAYTITPVLVDSQNRKDNYSVTLVNGTLTVTAAITLATNNLLYVAGNDAILISTNGAVNDGGSLNFEGATLTVTLITNLATADILSVASQGSGAGQIELQGSMINYGGVTVAVCAGGTGGQALTFALNTNANSAVVTALLRRLSFGTVNTNTDLRVLETVLTYGDITVSARSVLVIDRPPVSLDDELFATKGVTIQIPFSAILTNDYDVDQVDTVTITAVSGVSAFGGRVTQSGAYFNYRPPTAAVTRDLFAYLVADGRGGESIGIVTITFLDNNRLLIDAAGLTQAGVHLTMGGLPGHVYEIQVSTDLVNWSILDTVTADSMGVIQIIDAAAQNAPQRFYRAQAL